MISLRGLAVDALVGLVILFVANALGLGVQISLLTFLICAIFGVPGAILVILLALLDVAFAAAVFPSVPLRTSPKPGLRTPTVCPFRAESFI